MQLPAKPRCPARTIPGILCHCRLWVPNPWGFERSDRLLRAAAAGSVVNVCATAVSPVHGALPFVTCLQVPFWDCLLLNRTLSRRSRVYSLAWVGSMLLLSFCRLWRYVMKQGKYITRMCLLSLFFVNEMAWGNAKLMQRMTAQRFCCRVPTADSIFWYSAWKTGPWQT